MKNLITIVFTIFTLSIFAQETEQINKKSNFTSEQIATLQTKQMTLHLDLTEAQQKKVYQVQLKNVIERKAKKEENKALRDSDKKLTSDEKFKRKIDQLDAQIAKNNEMKQILNDEQYQNWKKSKAFKKRKITKKGEAKSKGNKLKKRKSKQNKK